MNRKKGIIGLGAAVAVIAIVAIAFLTHNAKTLVKGEKGHYTYSCTDGVPVCWSPVGWTAPQEQQILAWTTSPLYDIQINEEGYALLPELAAAEPEDVTPDYAGSEVYGISEAATEGYAWKIRLREDALWEDGTPVTTADFERTLQYYLDFERDFADGMLPIANAAEYEKGVINAAYDGDAGYADVPEEELLFSITEPNVFCGNRSLEEYYEYRSADVPEWFLDAEGNDLYEELKALTGESEYVPLTEEIKTLLIRFCSNCGSKDEQAYRRLCFYMPEEQAGWESVGFETDGDYAMTFILSGPVTAQELAYGLSRLYLIHSELYQEDADAYGTDKDHYLSYGPYKIASYDAKEGMTLERNETWFGYGDEAFADQYRTTDIKVMYGLSHEEELALWNQGNLSAVRLTAADRENGTVSAMISGEADGAVYAYLINSDLVSLKEEQREGENHSLLYYKDFRHAISLAMDRAAYVQTFTYASEPGFGLLGIGYLTDPEGGEHYRETETAQAVLCSVYGAEAVSELSGYDVEKAAAYLKNAYEACLEDGNIQDTDRIVLSFYSEAPANNPETEIAFLQAALDAAAQDTKLAGRIQVVAAERADAADIRGSILQKDIWNPYGVLGYFCDAKSQKQKGYYEDTYKTTITLSGEKISMTSRAWYEQLCTGSYHGTDTETKVTILAALEKQILNTYSAVPVAYGSEWVLYAHRLTSGAYTDGGSGNASIRYLTYSMDDAEWADYCKEQDYSLGNEAFEEGSEAGTESVY